MKPTHLFKTTIVIWSDFDPTHLELDELARDAMSGDSFCEIQDAEKVMEPTLFPATDFFDLGTDWEWPPT